MRACSPHQLDRNGEPLALLHAEPRRAGPPDQRLRERLQLHQVHDLRGPPRRSRGMVTISHTAGQHALAMVVKRALHTDWPHIGALILHAQLLIVHTIYDP